MAVIQFHSIGMQIHDHANISEVFANLLKDIGIKTAENNVYWSIVINSSCRELDCEIVMLNV